MSVPVVIVGKPTAESDAAVARFLEQFLEREHPGTTWTVLPKAASTPTQAQPRASETTHAASFPQDAQ